MAQTFEQAVTKLVRDFEYSDEQLKEGVKEFKQRRLEGLAADGKMLALAPTFVTDVPHGDETGDFLALDLGGTNLRVCHVKLIGGGKYEMKQSKFKLPREYQQNEEVAPLIDYMVDAIEKFVKDNFPEKFGCADSEKLPLGFTFSFPMSQTSITESKLLRWTKGFNIPEVVGEDFGQILNERMKERNVPVVMEAICNDTVGTMVTRAYTSDAKNTFMGIIFGTGSNGAYIEWTKNIGKLNGATDAPQMALNVEWGATDLDILHPTRYDLLVDHDTPNPGKQIFEKRVGGMYLGELFRRALFHLIKVYGFSNGIFPPSMTDAWSIDTSILSAIVKERTADNVRSVLNKYKIRFRSDEEALMLYDCAYAVGRRAARMSAIPIAAILEETGRLGQPADIAVDGSVIEYYPGFENLIREGLRVLIGEENEKKVTMGIAKDGSGIGAALCALQALKQKKN
ncbi:hexokinase 2 [Schizosaccharomyces japonicus yFS275]|uniref:Phosphotransferase n=1 Tax=Schizosaccharomyces japonicus (strain yFS275 / FY16936) TaxID=402676 RepID=B6K6Z4_SCHJY|nr:hexokinase 2 [Schizosaccharomyces japonicus yFS275]EEB09298.1 hexokinase 2 [Schizosaccharomyces japonicus yFS275]